jgi:hypothetical protein
MPRGKEPEKRGIGLGCRQDRKGRISESKRDELSRETRKSRQQLTEKDGVRNIPMLNKEQMRKIKMGLEDLFKHEINALMTEFQPNPGDWDG